VVICHERAMRVSSPFQLISRKRPATTRQNERVVVCDGVCLVSWLNDCDLGEEESGTR
jgi:hypothetical protein